MRVIVGLLFALFVVACSQTQPINSTKNPKVDLVVVNKKARTLRLYKHNKLLKTYDIALGRQPTGAKRREHDGRTPEGRYFIDFRNPDSRYHMALHISYPNKQDTLKARLQHKKPGKDIMIHGIGNKPHYRRQHKMGIDWTNGCIAVTNAEIEELWRLVPDQTPIIIRA